MGCSCPVCTSPDPRDNRYRASIFVEGAAGERILVDTGPEFRLQALRARITGIDAVLLTHPHADHLHGIDDLRPLTMNASIPVYANELTYKELTERFSYIWSESTQKGGGLPRISPVLVTPTMMNHGFHIGAIKIRPIPVWHGRLPILGWKFTENKRRFVYITDEKRIPYLSFLKITGCDAMVLGALRIKPHTTHYSFDEALSFIHRLVGAPGGKKLHTVAFTHITHSHTHTEIEAYCQNWMREHKLHGINIGPAYDTMRISV